MNEKKIYPCCRNGSGIATANAQFVFRNECPSSRLLRLPMSMTTASQPTGFPSPTTKCLCRRRPFGYYESVCRKDGKESRREIYFINTDFRSSRASTPWTTPTRMLPWTTAICSLLGELQPSQRMASHQSQDRADGVLYHRPQAEQSHFVTAHFCAQLQRPLQGRRQGALPIQGRQQRREGQGRQDNPKNPGCTHARHHQVSLTWMFPLTW